VGVDRRTACKDCDILPKEKIGSSGSSVVVDSSSGISTNNDSALDGEEPSTG